MNTKNNKQEFLNAFVAEFGHSAVKRSDVKDFANQKGFSNLRWFMSDDTYKCSRGMYCVPSSTLNQELVSAPMMQSAPTPPTTPLDSLGVVHSFIGELPRENHIPEVDKLFVKHGEFDLVSRIIGSKLFYPIFITGLSGNGKTFGVEQACAAHHREMFRVNITIETDEDDLLGGFRLVNDSTKWFDGPVVRAMKSGGVLLLDEVDLGSNKLLCLQPVLEGKGILLKKINQFVKPAPGFTIVATANTKGQGSETGKFVGTNILNEAFLERFCATFEQKYPEERVEKSILKKLFSSHGLKSDVIEDFITKLVTWAFGTRKTFETGGTSDLISTRRLVHIVNAYVILGHPTDETDRKSIGERRKQAIELCIARFDESTKISFMNFYENIDPYLNMDDGSKPVELNESEQLESKEHDILSILTNQS